jgi:hypothetical protein
MLSLRKGYTDKNDTYIKLRTRNIFVSYHCTIHLHYCLNKIAKLGTFKIVSFYFFK